MKSKLSTRHSVKPGDDPGGQLAIWWKKARAEKYSPPRDPKSFWSDLRQAGFAATEAAAKKRLQLVCRGRVRLTQKQKSSLEKFLGPIPADVMNAFSGRSQAVANWAAEVSNLQTEFKPFSSPISFMRGIGEPLQGEAVVRAYRRFIEELREIQRGRIPLPVDINSYFNLFMGLISDGNEVARVAAPLVPIAVREKMNKIKLLDRIKEAVKQRTLDIEYVISIDEPASLENPEVIAGIRIYLAISTKVFLFYRRGAIALSESDVNRSIVLLEGRKWVFTHGWDYEGNLNHPVHHLSAKDYIHYANIYEKLRTQSVSCPDEVRNNLPISHTQAPASKAVSALAPQRPDVTQ